MASWRENTKFEHNWRAKTTIKPKSYPFTSLTWIKLFNPPFLTAIWYFIPQTRDCKNSFYLSRSKFELEMVKLQRGRDEVEGVGSSTISVWNRDRRIKWKHICWHPWFIISCLIIHVLKHYALPSNH